MKTWSLLILLLLTGCSFNQIKQADADAIRTEAVATFASSLTETVLVFPTASPTLTSLPTFTPVPSSETPPAPEPQANTCYNLIWLKDVTIPDGTNLKAGERFTKTWLVQNNGRCAWAPGFEFKHVGGDSMRGQTVRLVDPIPVGAKREISVELVVPSGVSGLVQSSWRMADSNGVFFGDTLTVNITVGGAETQTPAP